MPLTVSDETVPSLEGGPRPGSVTLVVVAYSHAKYVEQCLDSAADQTYEDLTLLIFDDCSTDNTVEIIRSYLELTGTEATFVAHDLNRGLCATLNEALGLVETEFVAFLSADDWMEADRFEVKVPILSQLSSDYALLANGMYRVDQSGRRSQYTRFDEFYHEYINGATSSGYDRSQALKWGFSSTLSHLYRARVLMQLGGFDESLVYEDYDILLRILYRHRIAYDRSKVVNFRDAPGSLSDRLVDDAELRLENDQRVLLKHRGLSATTDDTISRRITRDAKDAHLAGSRKKLLAQVYWCEFRRRPNFSCLVYLISYYIRLTSAALRLARTTRVPFNDLYVRYVGVSQ